MGVMLPPPLTLRIRTSLGKSGSYGKLAIYEASCLWARAMRCDAGTLSAAPGRSSPAATPRGTLHFQGPVMLLQHWRGLKALAPRTASCPASPGKPGERQTSLLLLSEAYLVHGHDLAVSLLHSAQFPQKVPVHKSGDGELAGTRSLVGACSPLAPLRAATGLTPTAPRSMAAGEQGMHVCTHQNLLLARMASGAQTFMRYTVGLGSCSVGMWRPTTWYWWNLKMP